MVLVVFKELVRKVEVVVVLFSGVVDYVEVKAEDTAETLQQRIMEEAEWNILPEAVKLFCEDKLTVKNNIVYIGE